MSPTTSFLIRLRLFPQPEAAFCVAWLVRQVFIVEIRQSGEDYLKSIYLLEKETGIVRSVDVARYTGFSKASVSHAVSGLKSGGYILIDGDGYLHLTVTGQGIAENLYERYCFFRHFLMTAGVDRETAEQEACQLEHWISHKSFVIIRDACMRNNATKDGFVNTQN